MKYKLLTLVAIGLLSATSCSNEENVAENRVARVDAILPDFLEENATRSQISVSSDDKIDYSWAVGDVLGVFPDEGNQVSFRLTESTISADGKNATFDGGAWALKNGHTYYSYFPFSYENFSESSSLEAIPVDYTGQSISSWGDTKNAGKYDFNAAGATSSSNGALSFQFQRLGSLLRVKLKLPATTTYQKLTLSTDAEVIPVKGKVNLSASTIAYIPQTYASEISVNLNDISGTKDQVAYVYMMLPPMTLLTQGKSLIATLSYGNGSWLTYNLCKADNTTPHTPDFKANTIYKRDAIYDPYSGHEYVDLGLSVKWATCNVGADSPEDYGDYFAWGETTPKDDSYDWRTYKLAGSTCYDMHKYCTKLTWGTVDNKTVLDPEDDAAHVNWGGDWRMPTKTELEELLNNCTWLVGTTHNGVNGYRGTSKINGNSIFLPFPGSRSGSSLVGAGEGGGYWSSSLYSQSCEAYELTASVARIDMYDVDRYFGESVRAVCP